MYENVGELENINEKQATAINMFVTGKSVEDIAKELNINANTIYRWKKQKVFKQALKIKQDLIFEDITLRLGAIGIDAVSILSDLMKNAVNENTRLKASTFIIDKLLQLKDYETIKKIEEIEFVLSSGGYQK